jgi:hypothetical protein
MRRIFGGIVMAICASTVHANLITNPSNESLLVEGEIAGWTEVVGANWTQRSANPGAFDGAAYFFAGAAPNGTLRQVVDVSSFAATIDTSAQVFEFSGRVRSFEQSNPDSSRIVVTYLAENESTLATFDSGEITDTTSWQLVTDSRIAPSLTRSIQIDLIAKRNFGTNNDGYFDALSLVAAPVPEPSGYVLMALGLTLVASRARARSSGSAMPRTS